MGVAIATVNGVKTHLGLGDMIKIPCGATHRLANPAKEPLVVIEVWIGDDLSEDDIIRLEDMYGRVKPFDATNFPAQGGIAPTANVRLGNDAREAFVPLREHRAGLEPHPGGRNF